MAIVPVLHVREVTRDRAPDGALQDAAAPPNLREPGVEVADRLDRWNVPIITLGARRPGGYTPHTTNPPDPGCLCRSQDRRAVINEQAPLRVERLDLPDRLPEPLALLGNLEHVRADGRIQISGNARLFVLDLQNLRMGVRE